METQLNSEEILTSPMEKNTEDENDDNDDEDNGQRNTEINGTATEKPLTFLDKIKLHCKIKDVTSPLQMKNGFRDDSDYVQTLPDDIDNNDIHSLLEKICSTKRQNTAAFKLQLLESLTNTCEQNPELYETIGSSPLVYYTESLLLLYNEALLMRHVTSSPKVSELILLVPILKLLILSAKMSVQSIRSIFLYRSEVLLKLMRATMQCSYNAIATFHKLRKDVSDKLLAGAIFQMSVQDRNALFAQCFAINISSLDMKMLGFYVTLYDTRTSNEVNVNLEMIQNRPPSGKEYTKTSVDNSQSDLVKDCCEDVDTADWSDMIVARVLLKKVALVYMKEDWAERLQCINNQIQTHMQVNNTYCAKPQLGKVYGFWGSEATFEGEALLTVQCLRGQVLTLTGEWALIWAIDVGLLGFIPKAKFCPLPEELTLQAPLISICLLRGPVCDMDEEFVQSAHQLLRIILETNAQTGKHMLLSESGDHVLSLLEYPEVGIRIAYLELLLCLSKNSKDVVKFFTRHQFDIALLGKLERFVHIYAGCLYDCKDSMEKEMETMIMILQTILEEKEDIKNWTENRRVSRVLWFLITDKKCKWKELLEKCLSILTGKQEERTADRRGSFKYGHRRSSYPGRGRGHMRSHHDYRGDRRNNGYSYRRQREYNHNDNSRQERNNVSSSSRQGSYSQRNLHVTDKVSEHSSSNELSKKQEHRERETANTNWNGAERTQGRQNWKWDPDRHAQSRTRCEEFQQDPWLMARRRNDVYQRPNYNRLSNLNTLKPPTPVSNRATASHHEIVKLGDDSATADDTESVITQMGEVSLDSESDYVIRGSKAAVTADQTHELFLEEELWEVKEVVLAQKLCGLLNNNVEASLYLGLTKDSIIEGIRLGRGDKDVFRNGIDRIMNRCLIPEVRANAYDIIFTPVLRQNEKMTDLTMHSLFVIEIRVRPIMHMVYMVYQSRKCFIRRGTETIEATVMQRKQDMMNAEEKALEESIEKMGEAATSDLASLAEFINKYLPS